MKYELAANLSDCVFYGEPSHLEHRWHYSDHLLAFHEVTCKLEVSSGPSQCRLILASLRFAAWANAVGLASAEQLRVNYGITETDVCDLSKIVKLLLRFNAKPVPEHLNTETLKQPWFPTVLLTCPRRSDCTAVKDENAIKTLACQVGSLVEAIRSRVKDASIKTVLDTTTSLWLSELVIACNNCDKLKGLLEAAMGLNHAASSDATPAFKGFQYLLQLKINEGLPKGIELEFDEHELDLGLGKHLDNSAHTIQKNSQGSDKGPAQKSLQNSLKPDNMISLGDRYALAKNIITMVNCLIPARWYVSLCSTDILFRTNDDGDITSISEPRVRVTSRPEAQEAGNPYKEYIYSLCRLLVQIAHWSREIEIPDWSKLAESSTIERLKENILDVAGERYWEAVFCCIKVYTEEVSGDMELFHALAKVVKGLQGVKV